MSRSCFSTYQQSLCFFYFHSSLVKFSCLLKVSPFIALNESKTKLKHANIKRLSVHLNWNAHHAINKVYLRLSISLISTQVQDGLFHAVIFIGICFYRPKAYNLTLAQPSFSEFPPHEDACDQSCLHKSLMHVHKEVKLQSAFSLGSRKLFVTDTYYICYSFFQHSYQHILDTKSCIFNQKGILSSWYCWQMRMIIKNFLGSFENLSPESFELPNAL